VEGRRKVKGASASRVVHGWIKIILNSVQTARKETTHINENSKTVDKLSSDMFRVDGLNENCL
jgi:hypothetical protein